MTKTKDSFWEWIKAIGIALLIAFIVRHFLFTNYVVYGESMMPTIQEGNRLIVNKINYDITKPQRFDLIVFKANEQEDYIKRIIGLPGDKVEYRNDKLYINDQPVEEKYLERFRKDLQEGSQLTGDFTLKDITSKKRVPEGMVFVLGDNRLHSIDSRHIGFVPLENIVGEVNLRYWPMSEFQVIH
ncbi:signal peptidase I [Pseudalkalibacillus salsuginis]|uniref:signal peptidase I n=1 Tax=Pseudalkalibacillus salsuginis TaxID=2910972 RepID=UPI001F3FA1CA|nr:signal peptidase I [Pseudalkalibacillus salsuginis]MCF6410982.1 signal peptidase I [Pseudalkalibacillus salsuginis]